MQHLSDTALVLSAMKYGEQDAIVTCFTDKHGLVRGMVKAALSKKNRAAMEAGTLVTLEASARLEGHLFKLSLEPLTPYPALILRDRAKVTALGSICALLASCLAEQDPHPEIFHRTHAFFEHLVGAGHSADWMAHYIQLELALLEATGFGLDLTSCAATGSAENLAYISPKSGRAVSAEAGAPYHQKLLPFSPVLRGHCAPLEPSHMRQGLQVTGHFLHHWLFESLGRSLPEIRQQLPALVA